jgi:Peptidase family M23
MLRKVLLGLSLSLSMLGVGAATLSKPASAAYPGATSCDKNEVSTNYDRNFSRGQFINYACGDKAVYFQPDGNLVVYKYNWNTRNWEAKWATGTWDGEVPEMRAARFSIQADGNIVLYNYSNKPIWATMTNGNRGVQVAMQNDGNWVVYTSDGRPVWATMTNGGTQRTFSAARDMLNKSNASNNPVRPISNMRETIPTCMFGTACQGGGAAHTGVDYFTNRGSQVSAICDGKVINAVGGGNVWDRFTIIEHANCGGNQTLYSYYGHIDPSVSVGSFVKRGQAIGTVAFYSYNNPNNDHLHFGVAKSYFSRGWGYQYGNISQNGWLNPQDFVRLFNW